MKIEINSKTGCPYCDKAKAYLKDHGIAYTEILLDDPAERNAMYDSFGLVGRHRSVPQIVVTEKGGKPERLGGYDNLIVSDLVERHNAGKFDMDF